VEVALIIRDLWRAKFLVLGLAVVSLLVAILLTYQVSSSAPFVETKRTVYAEATTDLLVDSPKSSLGDLATDFMPLNLRAQVYAQFMTSPPVIDAIARRAGIDPAMLSTQAPLGSTSTTARGGAAATAPPTQGAEHVAAGRTQRLMLEPQGGVPVVGVRAQARTPEEARRLADAAVAALIEYVTELQRKQRVPGDTRVQVEQLGGAKAGYIVLSESKRSGFVLAFVLFGAGCFAILLGMRVHRDWQTQRALDRAFLEDREAVSAGQ
jgi:hypothetical protein